jgi:hypothetical protein
MKAKIKKARKRMRIVKKVVYFLVMIGLAYFAVVFLYPKWTIFYASYQRINTSEIDKYYDLLTKRAKPSKDFVLDLGVKKSESLQPAVDRLKNVMGLGDYKIWLAHHDAEKPPAYIKTLGYGDMGILLSTKVKERREEVNLLVHELGHIYVWRLEPSVFGKCDQEKLVDCSGVFLGLGVLVLNGLTDEFRLLPGEGHETQKKFYGYLKPEQFGYLVARYCADHGIADEAVTRFLEPTGRKYFDIGRNYLKRIGYVSNKSVGSVKGIYWCSKCRSPAQVPLTEKTQRVKCPKCGLD